MITAPEAKENRVYRLFLIGKKSLPEIRKRVRLEHQTVFG
jgi:hypothetical protein